MSQENDLLDEVLAKLFETRIGFRKLKFAETNAGFAGIKPAPTLITKVSENNFESNSDGSLFHFTRRLYYS